MSARRVVAAVLSVWLWAAGAHATEIVELNTATTDQLAQLPGLGPRKAEAIVALRGRRPFTRVTQLLAVKGIGKKTLERLRPWVRVAPPPR